VIGAQDIPQAAVKSLCQRQLSMGLKPDRLAHEQQAQRCAIFSKSSLCLIESLSVNAFYFETVAVVGGPTEVGEQRFN